MSILLRPLINEKSMNLVTQSQFSFEVDSNANKSQIEKVIKSKFSVDVLSVRIVNLVPKVKMQRTRRGKFSKGGMKKAIIRLKKGQNIPLFESTTEKEVEVRTAEGEVLTTVKEKKSLFKGTKVKVEKKSQAIDLQTADKEKIAEETENRAPIKTSQKEEKKKGSK